jgi:hypothetical protein
LCVSTECQRRRWVEFLRFLQMGWRHVRVAHRHGHVGVAKDALQRQDVSPMLDSTDL